MTDPTPPQAPRRKRSLSGIKPTGSPHLGNYLGMVVPAIELQETHDAYYFVADYHALTSVRDPEAMRRATHELTATFLACGLDPERAAFFRQSDVPEVCELTWLLSCVITMGELSLAHAWKARKAEGTEGTALHGLFAYPVLMASDILIYDSDVVPVGKDQVQHVEMARDMAKRFNFHYGDTFRLPEPMVRQEVMTIPGIDGRKMSKSYNNGIDIFSSRKKLKQRLAQIVTDSTPLEAPKDPATCNVVALYRYFATPDELAEMEVSYRRGGYGYGHAKAALLEAMDRRLGPMRDKYEALIGNPGYLDEVLAAGADQARRVAQDVMGRAREKVGYPARPHAVR